MRWAKKRARNKRTTKMIVRKRKAKYGPLTQEGSYVADQLMTKVEKMNSTREKRVIKTWSRASTIIPAMSAYDSVHNGRAHIPVFVTENMVGHKLGEFSPTRTFKGHGGDKAAVK